MITIAREGARFIARFPFDWDTKEEVKRAGFWFDRTQKYWYTTDPAIAAKFDPKAHELAQQAVAASRATESDLAIPIGQRARRKGFDYFAYQKAGIEFIHKHRDTLLADFMGLGKSIQAIGAINLDPEIELALIVCPASIKLNWCKELWLWLYRDLPICLANGKDFPAVKQVVDVDRGQVILAEGTFTRGVLVINYEQVGKLRPGIDLDWHLLIVDETHYIKSSDALRTHNLLGKWHNDPAQRIEPIRGRKRIFMTGTPILNKPKELWTTLRALDPGGIGGNWRDFHIRYCAGHQTTRGGTRHWDIEGASNLEELQQRLRSGLMIRRMREEVLTDLPPFRRQIVAFQPGSKEEFEALDAERAHTAGTEAKLNQLRAEVERLSVDEASEAYKEAAAKLRKAQGVAFTETSFVRHRVALAKIPQCLAHIRDTLESENKIVVFTHHHDVGDAIASELAPYGVLRADGRDSVEVRDLAVWKFQNEPQWRVMVAGTHAMGEGHTLTASSTVIYCELDWTPGKLSQSESRLIRIGQRYSVLVQHLVLDGSMDARMTEVLVNKSAVIAAALDADRMVQPEPPALPAPAEPAPWQPTVLEISEFQIEAIHTGLKIVAGLCDGAVARDGCGFNKMDADFGLSLARRETLTPRQAAAGLKLISRYHRQLPEGLLELAKGE